MHESAYTFDLAAHSEASSIIVRTVNDRVATDPTVNTIESQANIRAVNDERI